MTDDDPQGTEEERLAIAIAARNDSDYACWGCEGRDEEPMTRCHKCDRAFHHDCAGINRETPGLETFVCEFCDAISNTNRGDEVNADEHVNNPDEGDDDLDNVDFRRRFVTIQQRSKDDEVERLRQQREIEQERREYLLRIEELEQSNQASCRRNQEANLRHQSQMRELREFHQSQMREVQEFFRKRGKNMPPSITLAPQSGTPKGRLNADHVRYDNNARGGAQGIARKQDGRDTRPTSLDSCGSEAMEAVNLLAMTLSRRDIQKLPEFEGDMKEWAYFESVYNATTIEGNYSEQQNVRRLHKALKKEALSLVRDKLMFSADASDIMDDLSSVGQ